MSHDQNERRDHYEPDLEMNELLVESSRLRRESNETEADTSTPQIAPTTVAEGSDTPPIRTRKRSRQHWFWVSKVDTVVQQVTVLPDGFLLGTMSDVDFSEWVKKSPDHVKNSTVCNVTWWRSNKAPLHHQFVIITIASRPKGASESVLYDLRLERIGKGVGFRGSAIHSITISHSEPLKQFEKNNTLIVGLFRGGENDEHGAGRLVSPNIPTISASTGTLDAKWRGPPASLRHVGHFVDAIIRLAPRYSLASSNCYYFARLLVYAISLRHYSFSTLSVKAAADVTVDKAATAYQSSIGQLFLILLGEERQNGVLLYDQLRLILFWVVSVVWLGGVGAGWWGLTQIHVTDGVRPDGTSTAAHSFKSLGFAALCITLLLLTGFWVIFLFSARSALSGLWLEHTQRLARAQTAQLVKALGESITSQWMVFMDSISSRVFLDIGVVYVGPNVDEELEPNLRARRGDFDLYFYTTSRVHSIAMYNRHTGRRVKATESTLHYGSESLRDSWPHNEQIYNPPNEGSMSPPEYQSAEANNSATLTMQV